MGKRESAALLALAVAGAAGAANADTRLSDREARWANAAMPVVAYARAQGLPLDVVVQPQPTPGLAPIALGMVDGRCKLVLSMRGNPLADDLERDVPGDLFGPVAEAIAAHEVAHCWRQVAGAWHTVPAGFSDSAAERHGHPAPGAAEGADAPNRQRHAMRLTRHEEGFADLVGLAWTWRQHPAAYARVHAWFAHERAHPPLDGSHHDTRVWLRLVERGGFQEGETPFAQVGALWQAGLAAGN